jgi:hypothetical protein
MVDKRNVYKMLVRKFVGKDPFGTSRRGWEDTTEMNITSK